MNPFYTTTNDATAMQSALTVTPSNTVQLQPPSGPLRPTRGVMVGTAGNLVVTFGDGTSATLTIPSTACGIVLPLAVTYVQTSSTASGIVAFF